MYHQNWVPSGGCSLLLHLLLFSACADSWQAEESSNGETHKGGLELFTNFILHELPELLFKNQEEHKSDNESDDKFRQFAMNDMSNEDIGNYSVQGIIARSGFKYKSYKVVSADGYITRLIRIINPLADQRRLKQPPVMLLHGGTIDYTTYVWASAIQHHPEKWPRPDGFPATSWNRSLGFMLANNGYDCWLVGTRGSDVQNEGHLKFTEAKSIERSEDQPLGHNRNVLTRMMQANEYWRFSMDEIVNHELPAQIDKVLKLSGATKVHLLSYSLSTMTTLTMLGERPDLRPKVHSLVSIAPILNGKGCSDLTMRVYKSTCALPDDLGATIYSQLLLAGGLRKAMLRIGSNRFLRYNFIKPFSELSLGKSSSKYLTLLEPAVLGHLFMPIGFKLLKHYFQQVVAGRLQKFDLGPIQNFLTYDSISPPKVDLTDLGIEHWLVISGKEDNLARPESVEQLLTEVKHPKPYKNIVIEGYNHLDLTAAINNDVLVNQPILEFYDQCQLNPPQEEEEEEELGGDVRGNLVN